MPRPALLCLLALAACGQSAGDAEPTPGVPALIAACQSGDYDGALGTLLAAAEVSPGSPDLAVGLGMCQWSEYDRESDPALGEAVSDEFSRAASLLRAGRASEFVLVDVLRYRAFFQGTLAGADRAGWDRAVQDLDEVVRLDPSVRSYVDRAAARAMSGDPDGTAADIEEARALAGDDAEDLARIDEATDRPALAAALAERG